MQRKMMANLVSWKQKDDKKPLIIKGARQVGKTWLMQEFGRDNYTNVVYINFDGNSRMANLFVQDFDINRIITGLEIESGIKIDASNTLLIFDEVQECAAALASLKYFYEKAPNYALITAGSMLGIALHAGTSFPVGKVEFLNLYPLSFNEFLAAMGEIDLLNLLEKQEYGLITTFRDKYINLLHLYYFIGGMPEAVFDFVHKRDFQSVRAIQKNILLAYEQDFSKHVSVAIVPRLRMLWNSIPGQLAKENKKFIYGAMKKGARAKEYEMALAWLEDYGLVYRVNRVNSPALPLKAYEDVGAFKLFALDVGLLAAIAELDVKILLEGDEIFKEFKGALTEQYVLQELRAIGNIPTYYWTNNANISEIDFIIQINNILIPVEAKASINLRAKSLQAYIDKFRPKVSIRTSTADYKQNLGLYDIPLYMLEYIHSIVLKTAVEI